MDNPLIQCQACEGCGQTEVTGTYAVTWKFLLKQKLPINGANLARMMKVNPTAMNNRLAWLEAHDLAVRERNGGECLWKAMTSK